ncbi:MAG: transposase [Bacilli bacterium]
MKFNEFIQSEYNHTFRNNNHVLQDIFKDWWDNFLVENFNSEIRSVVKHEVSKFIGCGSKENGFSCYSCDTCGNYLYVPFTCKSRFCPSCGVNSCLKVSEIMPSRCLDVPHRHITFTISNLLWPYFQKDRKLLDLIFKSASYTLLSWFKSQSKLEQFIPGIIATLHTFGRDLKWNPHIHILVTEGAMGRKTNWKTFTHFPFDMLRKRFMTKLLFELSKHIKSDSFKKIKNNLYKSNSKGFYVHAPKKYHSNIQISISYITRYTNRPAMAESRILNYDSNNPSVTFYYSRHEDNQRVEEKVHPFELIKRLIIHIPQKGFHMTRYYGIYAMKKSKSSHLKRIKEKLTNTKKWIDKLFLHFKCNPLKCSCGNTLKFDFIVDRKSQNFYQLYYPNRS